MLEKSAAAVEVFCSYAHTDEGWMFKLKQHLSLLERQGLLFVWHDRQIGAGREWAREIDTHLERAGLILLLISPAFIASDYCYGHEMKRALERHAANQARTVPILVRPVADWQTAEFAHLQPLPSKNFGSPRMRRNPLPLNWP